MLAEYHYAEGNITTNPSQLNYERWYDLRDVGTEKLTYGSAALGFPLGLGASFMVNYQFRLGIEFVWNLDHDRLHRRCQLHMVRPRRT